MITINKIVLINEKFTPISVHSSSYLKTRCRYIQKTLTRFKII